VIYCIFNLNVKGQKEEALQKTFAKPGEVKFTESFQGKIIEKKKKEGEGWRSLNREGGKVTFRKSGG